MCHNTVYFVASFSPFPALNSGVLVVPPVTFYSSFRDSSSLPSQHSFFLSYFFNSFFSSDIFISSCKNQWILLCFACNVCRSLIIIRNPRENGYNPVDLTNPSKKRPGLLSFDLLYIYPYMDGINVTVRVFYLMLVQSYPKFLSCILLSLQLSLTLTHTFRLTFSPVSSSISFLAAVAICLSIDPPFPIMIPL